jgi:hypothetical protein
MDARERLALLDDEEDDFGLSREAIENLLRDAPPGCLYCGLTDLEGDDD